MTKKQLQDKVNKLKAQRKVELETIKQERVLAYYESDKYLEDSSKEDALAVLAKGIDNVEVVYAELDRKLIAKYGYSVILDKLLTLASSLKYMPLVEKQALLKVIGISEISVEELLDSVGSTCYYSKDSHTVVPSVPFIREDVRKVLEKLEIELNIELTSELKYVTEAKLNAMYKRGEDTAEEMYVNTESMVIQDSIKYEE